MDFYNCPGRYSNQFPLKKVVLQKYTEYTIQNTIQIAKGSKRAPFTINIIIYKRTYLIEITRGSILSRGEGGRTPGTF